MSSDDPSQLRLHDTWNIYLHTHSISSNYGVSYDSIAADLTTVAQFWNMMNNLPSVTSLHQDTILYNNKKVIAYSMFRKNVLPEWEHAVNATGSEWGCRDCIDASILERMWILLCTSAVGEQLHNCVGIRVINKTNRTRVMHKIEVWMNSSDAHTTSLTFDDITNALGTVPHPTFTLMDHIEKKTQAHEYVAARKKAVFKRMAKT